MFNSLFGIRVISSPLCAEVDVPVRQHKKRRSQTEAYHRRIQKKWLKRFGTKKEGRAYMMSGNPFGISGGESILMSPGRLVMIRCAASKGEC